MDIREVRTGRERRDFVRFPFALYRNDPLWVSLLIRDVKRMLWGKESSLFQSGPHALYLALEGKGVLGRIAVGIDEGLNKLRGKKEGYVTLFECVDEEKVAHTLLSQAEEWLKVRGMESIVGPVSPTNGDDFRGMLIENFTDPPFIFTPYNPPYYEKLWESYGFQKYHIFVAFRYDLGRMPFEESLRAIEYAKKKYDFTIQPMSYDLPREEIQAVQRILEESLIPLEYDYLVPPTFEEVMRLARMLRKFVPPGFAQIAWAKGEPVGFAVAIPDYNEVLRRMRGRLFPTGWLAFLRYRKRISRGRAFLLFVTPSYQGKGVPTALLFELFKEGRKRGYVLAEGSFINVANTKMCREAENLGGIPYKKCALFRKEIER